MTHTNESPIFPGRFSALYKPGIANLTVAKRYPVKDRAMCTEPRITHYDIGADAYAAEQLILAAHKQYQYTGPKVLVSAGDTELFTRDVLGLDTDTAVQQQAG